MCASWACHVGRLVPFLPFNHIELHLLTVPYAPQVFAGVVLDDSCLVDKHIFLGVISINKAIARLDVEPFHGTSDLGS
jgi:hypothetical protein